MVINGKTIVCQVDSGAQTNLMSINTLNALGISKVDNRIYNNIFTFSGEKIPAVGRIFVDFLYNNIFLYCQHEL